MKQNRSMRLRAAFPSVILCLFLLCGFLPPVSAQDTVSISTVEDLKNLAKNCSLDTWSHGKTIVLQNDLDVTNSGFVAIPTFGGTFDGGGHTISGLSLTANEPVQGLFRYLQESGTIKNLTVNGTIASGEGKDTFGGIAGSNSGTIADCTFIGTIKGKSVIGGIAGVNEASGRIGGCETQGVLTGQKYTGGIAGENLGIILKSSNRSSINTTSDEASLNIEDINLDHLKQLEELEENTVPLSGHTDTGGIAGYSGGIIQSCTNSGSIGYQHMGYNIGGIAGRQAGYLSGCTNEGTVLGRKDVGGIVGQMEPYIILQYSEDKLQQLNGELSRLHTLVNQALDDVDITADTVSNRMNSISGYTASARDSSKKLLDQTSDFAGETADFVNQSMDSINDVSALITDTMDRMVPVVEDMETAADKLSESIGQLGDALDGLDTVSDSASAGMDYLHTSVSNLSTAMRWVQKAFSRIQDGMEDLRDAVVISDSAKAETALRQLISGIDDLERAYQDAQAAAKNLGDALKALDWNNFGEQKDAILAAVEDLKTALNTIPGTVKDIASALRTLQGIDISVNWLKVRNALQWMGNSLDDLSYAGTLLRRAATNAGSALSEFRAVSDEISTMIEDVKNAVDSVGSAVDGIASAFGRGRDLLRDLADREPITFPALNSDFHLDTEDLFSSITGISGEMSTLNDELKSAGKTLTGDLRQISDQFNVIMHLMIDAITTEDLDLSALMEDTSEQDIFATSDGKVSGCSNTGTVEADLNVGGVAGAMAIEFDLDPEDDISSAGKTSLNFRYETKTVLLDCINDGPVTAKKNNAGGLVGRMDLGTVQNCVGYGRVESTSGDYVGGVAGYSDAAIRRSYAKCALSGRNFVGGIAGQAKKVYNCYSIIQIEKATGRIGAIAGERSKKNTGISSNYFLDTGWAGIGGISYSGTAEPISYEALSQTSGLPDRFLSFSVTFRADGNVLETVDVKFGDNLSGRKLPDIPQKDGFYGYWPEFDFSRVIFSAELDAVYEPWITVLPSTETEPDGGKSLALAEGRFTEAAVLQVTEGATNPPAAAKSRENAVVWELEITGTDLSADSEVPVRLLKPGDGRQIKVWRMQQDGQWEDVKYQSNGSYLLLSMEGTEGTFCIASTGGKLILELTIGLGLLALIALVILLLRRRSKKSKPKFKFRPIWRADNKEEV